MDVSPVYVHALANLEQISLEETLRYMGCGSNTSEEVISLAKRAAEMVLGTVSCKACYRLCNVSFPSEDVADFSFMQISSSQLCAAFCGCEKAFVFAATIGIEADRLILQHKRTSPSLALALQAAGAAAIEQYCDILCDTVFENEASNLQMHATQRFSAGYGDLQLELQKKIFVALECERKIGLTLTDGCMMLPSKSVTAFVGIRSTKDEPTDKCNRCKNTNCVYRKGSDQK